jgi:hypothetical protein
MTILQMPLRTSVRPAGLVDVPAVVRLIAPPVTEAVDREQAQRAMRLMLAHYALEEGQVWVAERTGGELLAAAVWLPPGIGAEPPQARFGGLLARELADCTPKAPPLSAALNDVRPDEPHWTVAVFHAPDDTEAWDREVVAALLAPGLRTVDAEHGTAVALTQSPRHMDQLRPFGFRHPRPAHLAPDITAWLTTRLPEDRLAA